MPVRVIAGIAAEKPRLAAANLMTVCIVIGIAAEKARLAAADLLPEDFPVSAPSALQGLIGRTLKRNLKGPFERTVLSFSAAGII